MIENRNNFQLKIFIIDNKNSMNLKPTKKIFYNFEEY